MGVLDDLIKIKTARQEDDLLKLLDEIPVYEKLSVNPQFADLKNSEVTRSKCPLLAGFKDGNLYETLLADLAANVYLQIENAIPDVLRIMTDLSPRQEKQKEALQKGITRIEYREIMEYDHEQMKSMVIGVFTKKESKETIIAIITKTSDGYVMYHGTYTEDASGKRVSIKSESTVVETKKGVFIMDSYSVLGNNSYPFGRYSRPAGSYTVMLGERHELYLIKGEQPFVYNLDKYLSNKIYFSKNDAQMFAEAVAEAIESVVEK